MRILGLSLFQIVPSFNLFQLDLNHSLNSLLSMLPVIIFCLLKTDLPVLSEITFGSKEEESNNFVDSSLAIEGILINY